MTKKKSATAAGAEAVKAAVAPAPQKAQPAPPIPDVAPAPRQRVVNESGHPAMTNVGAGDWLVMKNERWFRASEGDVNIALDRETTKLGVALSGFSYEADKGAKPADAETYTLRQYWKDKEKPTLDFSKNRLRKELDDTQKWQGVEKRRRIERRLLEVCRAMETLYDGFADEADEFDRLHEAVEASF